MSMVSDSWDKFLDLKAVERAVKWSENLRSTEKIYPASENIFKALELCPLEKVKVVIMGQDPYPGKGRDGIPHAHGLAFSSQSSEIPKSLQNIYKELNLEFQRPCHRTADLTDWAEQGVLLLNSAFTVQAGKPNSHQGKYWDPVVKDVIENVSQLVYSVVFMLWGNNALQIYPYIKNKNRHLILESTHPSPMSAHRGFIGCGHFIQANRWLSDRDIDSIFWI